MDVALQKHGAKHIYRVPEGLRELCADISREVLRAQPTEIYCFVADYIDALLITRENAKVAVRVVNNILLGSELIIDILRQSGLSLEQIAIAATRIQNAFRSYLEFIDVQNFGIQEENRIEEHSRICIRNILETTGTSWEQAELAATTIQTAFRIHYNEMLEREARGEVQWQRAVINTIAILRKAGVSQEEAAKAATLIQSSYRGYYTRRNVKLKMLSGAAEAEEKKRNNDTLEPRETIQAVAWMDMMFQDSKHTIEHTNEAATVIQSAFRGYRTRANEQSTEQGNMSETSESSSTQSMVVEAILDNLRQRIWSKVKSVEKFPEEFGSRQEMEETVNKIETEYNNKQRKIRISEQFQEDKAQEIEYSVAEEKVKVETTKDGDEEKTENLAGGAQAVETVGEIDPITDETDSSAAIKSQVENETEEHEEHETRNTIMAREPEAETDNNKNHQEHDAEEFKVDEIV